MGLHPACGDRLDRHLNLPVVVPGVAENEMKVTLQGNQLVLEGERKAPEYFTSNGSAVQLLARDRPGNQPPITNH